MMNRLLVQGPSAKSLVESDVEEILILTCFAQNPIPGFLNIVVEEPGTTDVLYATLNTFEPIPA
ncbi:hypothetical protein SNK04_003425 [Fusarium graminearum]